MPKLPIIHSTEEQDLGPYRMERLDLEFSNGEHRRYERLKSRGHGAVMIAAIPQPDTILLIREYAAGKHAYEIGLPKGRMDAGESILDAANRELKEEVGFGARRLGILRTLSLAPTYMAHVSHVVLAEDLYPERLQGDEPELLDVVPWRLDALHELVQREDVTEGRSIAALFIAREFLQRRGRDA